METRVGLLAMVVAAAACDAESNVEEVDRGAKPIEGRAGIVIGLAAWDEDGVAHTLVELDGVRRIVAIGAGDLVVADEEGRVPDEDATAAALREQVLGGALDLALLRAELLD